MKIDEIRPEVIEFAKSMESILQFDDFKYGWETMSKKELIIKISKHFNKLLSLTLSFDDSLSNAEISKECIRISNYLMFLFNNTRGK